MVSEARKYGVKLVLSFINNYKDYGGKAQYVEWAKSGGVSIGGEDDFYTNGVVRDYYKNHVKVYTSSIGQIIKICLKLTKQQTFFFFKYSKISCENKIFTPVY